MALYTQGQLNYERSIGLEFTDAENECYNDDGSRDESKFDSNNWSKEEFENWLSAKSWSDRVKNMHRGEFKGFIRISDSGISYER